MINYTFVKGEAFGEGRKDQELENKATEVIKLEPYTDLPLISNSVVIFGGICSACFRDDFNNALRNAFALLDAGKEIQVFDSYSGDRVVLNENRRKRVDRWWENRLNDGGHYIS
ncbi:MAG: hypothetical protein WCV59_01520 [Parcubacteria group bacterium]|jgi:hypothetical protein